MPELTLFPDTMNLVNESENHLLKEVKGRIFRGKVET